METEGQRIKRIRESKKMSQGTLAKKLGFSDGTAVSKYERDLCRIQLQDVGRWAKALGVSPLDLMPEEDIKKKAALDAKIIKDSELKIMIEKYYNLEIEKQKIVRDLIDTLSK